jgi:hypothetical protein
MNSQLTPGENQLLWMLVANGGEAFEDALKHSKSAKEKPNRDALARRGLVVASMQKRQLPGKKSSRAMHLKITPAGWTFCNEVIAWMPPAVKKSKADLFLQWLMPRLKNLFDRNTTAASLSDFINKSEPPSASNIEQHIRAACLELGGGRETVRIRIADLRKRLADVPSDQLTEGLRELSRRRELTLYPIDDPRQITPDDEAAAIRSSTGVPQHILYYGGIAS